LISGRRYESVIGYVSVSGTVRLHKSCAPRRMLPFLIRRKGDTPPDRGIPTQIARRSGDGGQRNSVSRI
jgi:hypothetical protein